MTRTIALTRAPTAAIAQCELTHVARRAIDLDRAMAQHAAYETVLEDEGVHVRRLPPLPDHPDAVFVEDTVVVLPHVAVITRPGAASRRAECATVNDALTELRPRTQLRSPASLDGGDVLQVGEHVFVGLGGRTNQDGFEQLAAAAETGGLRMHAVTPRDCLHLKSAATALDDETVLIDPRWVDPGAFAGLRTVPIDPNEEGAANVLRLPSGLIVAQAFPRTRERLDRAGYRTRAVDASELAKAEGALTCCSVLISVA